MRDLQTVMTHFKLHGRWLPRGLYWCVDPVILPHTVILISQQFFVACEPALSGYSVGQLLYLTIPQLTPSLVCYRLLPSNNKYHFWIDASADDSRPPFACYCR